MHDAEPAFCHDAATPNLVECIWRRKRAKIWWSVALSYWSAFALAHIFPGTLEFVIRPPVGYLILLCFPPLIFFALSISWQRQFFANADVATASEDQIQLLPPRSRMLDEYMKRDRESWRNSSISAGTTSYRVRQIHDRRRKSGS